MICIGLFSYVTSITRHIAHGFTCILTFSGIVQGHSIGINHKDTQYIEAVAFTTPTHVVGLVGADVEVPDTSKYSKCALIIIYAGVH